MTFQLAEGRGACVNHVFVFAVVGIGIGRSIRRAVDLHCRAMFRIGLAIALRMAPRELAWNRFLGLCLLRGLLVALGIAQPGLCLLAPGPGSGVCAEA